MPVDTMLFMQSPRFSWLTMERRPGGENSLNYWGDFQVCNVITC